MHYRFVLIFLLLTFSSTSQACDICGCKLGGYYFGLLPQYQSHFVGLQYSRAHFSAYIDNAFTEDEYSADTYHRIDLLGRWMLSDRWQLNLNLPYVFNQMEGNVQQVDLQGLGDAVVLPMYQVLRQQEEEGAARWRHALLLGAGLKLPLGSFEREDQGEIINRNFQTGSGSLDYLLAANYTLRKQQLVINADINYRLNTANQVDYRFGNQLSAALQAMYIWESALLSVVPTLGLMYEQADRHREGKVIQGNTGGEALLGLAGLQLHRNQWSLNAQYQRPLSQYYYTDRVSTIEAQSRWLLGLFLNFE